jgi:ketosteroid isomerase-like protein
VDSENVLLVRAVYAAWGRGDFSSAEWADPEVECVSDDALLPGSTLGPAQMAQAWGEWLRAWTDFRVEAEEFLEIDGERVLVLARYRALGKWSGMEFGPPRTDAATLFHLRQGKVVRLVLYLDHRRALADAGVAPAPGPAGA